MTFPGSFLFIDAPLPPDCHVGQGLRLGRLTMTYWGEHSSAGIIPNQEGEGTILLTSFRGVLPQKDDVGIFSINKFPGFIFQPEGCFSF